jgi:hypothetical protein
MHCPICGAPHATCGGPTSAAPLSLTDLPNRGRYTVDDLREYRYTLNGMPTTGMLTAHDAELLGAVPVEQERVVIPAKAMRPANKARRPATKDDTWTR